MTFNPETDLKLERDIAASPEKLWRCWTEADLLKQWFAPKPVETVDAVINPEPGGRFYTLMRVPDYGDMPGEGCILVADPAKRLVWTNAMEAAFRPTKPADGPGSFLFSTELTFAPSPRGCLYTVVVRHTTAGARAQHEEMGFHDGWGTAASQLEALAKGL